MFHMLSPTFASPVNIQHVPTFARFRGQHVVNICSSRPPSDGLAQRTLKIKLERLKNRSKPPKSRSKSLDSSKKRPQTGLTGNIFNICKATGRVNIQHCCQHLQQMASTFNINSCGDLVNVFPHGYGWVPPKREPATRNFCACVSVLHSAGSSAGGA